MRAAWVVPALVLAACGGGPAEVPDTATPVLTVPRPTTTGGSSGTPSTEAPTLLATGDIACGPSGHDTRSGGGALVCQDEATAGLVDSLDPTVLAVLGDIQYEDGSITEFEDHYHRRWSEWKERTRPAPGNHEYRTPGAAGYFEYFGALAGEPDRGYYSYEIGDWHVVVLNTNCDVIDCGPESNQARWLAADLAATDAVCTVAYGHHPRFSSGWHGDQEWMSDLFGILYQNGVELYLAGHDHDYERFAPLDPDRAPDPMGVRQFVVGTGGYDTRVGSLRPGEATEAAADDSFGVLELTLQPTSYLWRFVPIPGSTFTDQGQTDCH